MIKSFGIGLLAGALVTAAMPVPRLPLVPTRTITNSNAMATCC